MLHQVCFSAGHTDMCLTLALVLIYSDTVKTGTAITYPIQFLLNSSICIALRFKKRHFSIKSMWLYNHECLLKGWESFLSLGGVTESGLWWGAGTNTLSSHPHSHCLNWDQSDHCQPVSHRGWGIYLLPLGVLGGGDSVC